MWKNKWMMLCLLVGNILLVGIVSGTPLYSHATMQRILQKDLDAFQIANNAHPATMSMSYSFNNVRDEHKLSTYETTANTYVPAVIRNLGVPPLSTLEQLTMVNWHSQPATPREERPRIRALNITTQQNFEEHITLVAGRMPANELVEGNVLEVLTNETTLIRQDLLLDELLEVSNVEANDGRTFRLRIVGQFESNETENTYWISNPNTQYDMLYIPEKLFRDYFIPEYSSQYRMTATWTTLLNYKEMRADNVDNYLDVISTTDASYNTKERIWQFTENFSTTINAFTASSEKLSITLWVLQAPIYILLAFYIYMVSRQILTLEQNDISVLKSRGASRRQLFLLYTLQSLFVSVVSYALGIWLGVNLCRALGASSGFLNMVQRAALSVEITLEALLYGGAAILLSVLTMLLPVIRFSRVTIVDYKRNKSGKPKKAVWQRFFLDVLCFGVASYGLYTFESRRELMASQVNPVNSVDPLLYLASSLFIIGMGLLCLRLFPYLIKLVFFIGKRLWSPSVYASLLKVIRSAGEEQFIMIFLVFTLAVGIFDAKAARTVNLNSDHMIQYSSGADLVFQEVWSNNMPAGGGGGGGAPAEATPSELIWYEPDFERYTKFPEVDSITKVMEEKVDVRKSGQVVSSANLMAVESNSFGNTLWFRNDLLPVHINHFLNSLGSQSDGVLLSENFRTNLGFALGDVVTYTDSDNNDAIGIVNGFIEHWPGYSAKERVTERSGETVEADSYLLVSNLGYLQTRWGVQPYQIWMKTNSSTNRFFYDFRTDNNLRLSQFSDAKSQLVESKSDPILQGTNGVLTVGFIVTLLVCFTGFLIFWILSIKSRVLQFGIFRAMGMTMGNIISLLINEQLFITFTAIGIGALVGEVSSRLFVPLIQISFSASEQVIPLRIVTQNSDYINLFGIIGGMILLCLFILGVFISRIKIAQALKLGED
jgi:putative ABC transport system permease protein